MKRRAGRRKKMNVDREPNGRIQRVTIDGEPVSKFELDAMTWKRRQINPSLSSVEARKPEHGSVIAAWRAQSEKYTKAFPGRPNPIEFSPLHFSLAEEYHQLWRDWIAICDGRRVRSGSELNDRVSGQGRDAYTDASLAKAARIEERFKNARKAILACGAPLAMMAIETIVIENQPAEDMRGDLRMALNALSRIFGKAMAA